MRFTPILAAAAFFGITLADPSYSCKGQAVCGSQLHLKKWCDIAVNDKLTRNDDINYGSPESSLPDTGVCYGAAFGNGCGVFIRGPSHCKFSGNKMWHDYQEIRDSGCGICGFKKYDDGCEMVIDQVSGC
ncbi:hypothetical protein ACO1O0_001642 [Amphichorda felina]